MRPSDAQSSTTLEESDLSDGAGPSRGSTLHPEPVITQITHVATNAVVTRFEHSSEQVQPDTDVPTSSGATSPHVAMETESAEETPTVESAPETDPAS